MGTGNTRDPRQYYTHEIEPPIEKVLVPFQKFFKTEATSGLVLIFCALAAMIMANSPLAEDYFSFFNRELTIGLQGFALSKPLQLWINEGLMAIFFFVVGLEIKREIVVGELSSPRQAILPIGAAVGGMVLPALVYFAFNGFGPGSAGWGVPMATDIAFALGILALLGDRVPLRLKVFLTAVAIVDDIGAVLVIAFFYTAQVAWVYLAFGAVVFLMLLAGNLAGIRWPLFYVLLGLVLWVLFLKSGVHATVEGVLLAMLIPARVRCSPREFVRTGKKLLTEFEQAADQGDTMLTNKEQHSVLQALETACQHAEPPMQRLEHSLVPWSAYLVMPVFALANAGVPLIGGLTDVFMNPVSLGIFAGLVLGKQAGILGAVWLIVRMGASVLPPGINWRHLHGASLLAGIGFTMSLFISQLAFADPALVAASKVGIICASIVAALAGWLVLRKA